jgi:hypothetical protein
VLDEEERESRQSTEWSRAFIQMKSTLRSKIVGMFASRSRLLNNCDTPPAACKVPNYLLNTDSSTPGRLKGRVVGGV